MGTHPVVQTVVRDYLTTIDTNTPDLVEGLYLVGSVALDDFHSRHSDIDFVAVTASPLTEEHLAALRRTHRELTTRRPFLDGIYVTWSDLTRDPSLAWPGAAAHHGRIHRRSAGRDPVTWHTLANHAVPVRGPHPADLRVWTNADALTGWTRRNLDDYWRDWLRRGSRLLSRPGLACLHPWGPVWGVLGLSRVHHTLTTGQIISKSAAGRYARDTFDPRWRRVVDECLRLRTGEGGPARYRDPLTRRRDALAFVAMAIDHAQRTSRPGGPPQRRPTRPKPPNATRGAKAEFKAGERQTTTGPLDHA